MPTIRQLANDLQLAKGTVAKAYALLEESDVLETRGHRGWFVLPLPLVQQMADAEASSMLGEVAENYIVAAKQRGVELKVAVAKVQRG